MIDKNQEGFSLLEVMIATVLVSSVMLALLDVVGSTLRSQQQARYLLKASWLLQGAATGVGLAKMVAASLPGGEIVKTEESLYIVWQGKLPGFECKLQQEHQLCVSIPLK